MKCYHSLHHNQTSGSQPNTRYWPHCLNKWIWFHHLMIVILKIIHELWWIMNYHENYNENCSSECFFFCVCFCFCPYSDQNRDRGSFIGAPGWLFSKTHGPASVDQVGPITQFNIFQNVCSVLTNITQTCCCISCRIWAEPICEFVGPLAKSWKWPSAILTAWYYTI